MTRKYIRIKMQNPEFESKRMNIGEKNYREFTGQIYRKYQI